MNDTPSLTRQILGWAIHAYTGTGLLIAAWVVSLLMNEHRTPDTYRYCFLLMLLATIVDATDGTLARLVRIKEAVPSFDGRRLDDLVDFLMYTCLPLLLIDRAGLVPSDLRWVLLLALAASGYGFSQSGVKTDEGAFMGFPSYWNIVAFYLYVLPVPGEWAVALIVLLSLLTFVPSYYPYPTQPGTINRLMLILCVPWVVVLLIGLSQSWNEEMPGAMVRLTIVYPFLYLAVAWGTSLVRMILRRMGSGQCHT